MGSDPQRAGVVLAGWRRGPWVGGVELHAPDGATRILVRARLTPPPPLRRLVDRAMAERFGAITGVTHVPIDVLVTREGELAALASANVTIDGHATGCSAAVAGDDPCLSIVTVGSDHRAHTRRLIDELGLGCGAMRRRWFRYAPPAGWLGFRREGHSVWLHPAYPRLPARLTVFDARRFVTSPAERLDRFMFARLSESFTAFGESRVEDVTSDHDLAGRVRIMVGTLDDGRTSTLRIASAFADDRFSYLAHFEGPDDRVLEAQVRGVIASFRGLPCVPSTGGPAVYEGD